MKKKIKKLWVRALRGDHKDRNGKKYRQVDGALNVGGKFCCLGVLCDLYSREKDAKWEAGYSSWGDNPSDIAKAFLGESCSLPKKVQEWSGLKTPEGARVTFVGFPRSLVSHNDEYKRTFDEIATMVEEQL